MKYSEVERRISLKGCYWVRNGKNHPIWFSPITNKTFSLSYHKSEEVAKGTFNSIKKLSGVDL